MHRFLLSTLTFLLLAGQFAKAQLGVGKPEEIRSIKERPLLVVLEAPQEHVLKKLDKKKKTDLSRTYKEAVDVFNADLKAALELRYPFKDNGIEFMTYDQVRALSLDNNNEYAVLHVFSVLYDNDVLKEQAGHDAFMSMTGLNWNFSTPPARDDLDFVNSFTIMGLYLIEDFASRGIATFNNNPVGFAGLSDVFPSEASLIHGIATIEDYFEFRLAKEEGQKIKWKNFDDYITGERAPELKDLTLMIRKDMLSPEVNPRSLKALYPYPVQICTEEEMNSALLEQRPNTAYLLIIGNWGEEMTAYFTYASRADNNDVLGIVRPSVGGMIGAGYKNALLGGIAGRTKSGDEMVTKETMQALRLSVEGKGKK